MIVAHRFEVVGDDAVMHPRQQAFHPPQYPALTGIDKFHAFLKGVQRHHFLIEITDCLTDRVWRPRSGSIDVTNPVKDNTPNWNWK